MASGASPEEEQHGCTGLGDGLPASDKLSSELGGPGIKGIKIKEQSSSGDDFTPKVRKPYTITKQRVRWTDEEHKKFIEALKLYGRAWRKIEEHVGSKTAVQIRSHAQKFFSKVVRESNGGDTSSVKAIEIPPPRPKRKPMHPYPRKLISSVNTGIKVLEKQMSSASPNASEQDNQSPTSVLSAIGSDSSVEPDCFTPNGSPSSVSSALALNAGSACGSEMPKLPSEGVMSSCPDHEDENSSPNDKMPLELELWSQNSIFIKDEPSEAAAQSFKLFGKTVLITDVHGSSSAMETCEPESSNGRIVPLSAAPPRSCPTYSEYVWYVHLDKTVHHAETKSKMSNLASNVCCPIPLSWLSLSGNPLQPSMEMHSPAPVKARPRCDEKEEAESEQPVKRREETPLASNKLSSWTSSTNCGKGFVPYKNAPLKTRRRGSNSGFASGSSSKWCHSSN